MAPADSPLFLVGAQRSGTTALAYQLADAYARAGGCFTVNGKFFYLTARWLTTTDLAARHLRADEVIHGLRRRLPGGPGAEAWLARIEEGLRAAARQAAGGELTDRDDVIRTIAAQGYGTTTAWGDKYNEYLLELDTLDRLYPSARWIFLYRHPAEVTASMLRWAGDRPWNPLDQVSAERKWASWNDRWLDFRGGLAPERRWEASYDRLVQEDLGPQLARFAGVGLTTTTSTFDRRSPAAATEPVTEAARATWRRLIEL